MSNSGITIFRVQDKEGRGPWKPGFSLTWAEDRTAEEYEFLAPFPLEVMLQLRSQAAYKHLGFGCLSLEQLRRWITATEYQTLQRHGYRAVQMQADSILVESPSQCVFSRSLPLAIASPVELWKQPTNKPS